MFNETTEIYDKAYNKDGSLKHSGQCKMTFGRKDARCPRCIELLNGAPAREGWHKDYYKMKAHEERLDHIKHVCDSRCGPVCTFGEW